MVPYIERMAVDRHQWLSRASFRAGVALCQSIPGATAMQTAAYTGLRARGIFGALCAYAGFGLPAFALMLALSAVYAQIQAVPIGVPVFHGMRIVVTALVVNAAYTLIRTSLGDARDIVLALVSAVFLTAGGTPVVAIVCTGVLSTVLYRGVALPGASEAVQGESSNRSSKKSWPVLVCALVFVAGAMTVLLMCSRNLAALALLMLKVDLFAFGGGYASVPLMLHGVVRVHGWMDNQSFMDGIALGQVTPGPIVITATFVGYQVSGVAGAVVATVAVFTPSFVILLLTVPYFWRLQQSVLFLRAVRGALACFTGLLISVAIGFAMGISWNVPSALLAILAFIALRLKVSIGWIVIAGVVASALVL